MRQKLIAGNWKMNGSAAMASSLLSEHLASQFSSSPVSEQFHSGQFCPLSQTIGSGISHSYMAKIKYKSDLKWLYLDFDV